RALRERTPVHARFVDREAEWLVLPARDLHHRSTTDGHLVHRAVCLVARPVDRYAVGADLALTAAAAAAGTVADGHYLCQRFVVFPQHRRARDAGQVAAEDLGPVDVEAVGGDAPGRAPLRRDDADGAALDVEA